MKFDDASRSDMAINSIVKLASFLQRALDKGRSNYIEMGEVSKYVNYMIKTNATESLKYIEIMLENDKCKRIKRLRNDLLALFNELLDSKAIYETLIMPNGKIDREKLALMVEFDTDIIDSLKRLKNMLYTVNNKCEITIEEEKEIRRLAADIENNVIKKKDMTNLADLSPTN